METVPKVSFLKSILAKCFLLCYVPSSWALPLPSAGI